MKLLESAFLGLAIILAIMGVLPLVVHASPILNDSYEVKRCIEIFNGTIVNATQMCGNMQFNLPGSQCSQCQTPTQSNASALCQDETNGVFHCRATTNQTLEQFVNSTTSTLCTTEIVACPRIAIPGVLK
jgi:hypothetical protein